MTRICAENPALWRGLPDIVTTDGPWREATATVRTITVAGRRTGPVPPSAHRSARRLPAHWEADRTRLLAALRRRPVTTATAVAQHAAPGPGATDRRAPPDPSTPPGRSRMARLPRRRVGAPDRRAPGRTGRARRAGRYRSVHRMRRRGPAGRRGGPGPCSATGRPPTRRRWRPWWPRPRQPDGDARRLAPALARGVRDDSRRRRWRPRRIRRSPVRGRRRLVVVDYKTDASRVAARRRRRRLPAPGGGLRRRPGSRRRAGP